MLIIVVIYVLLYILGIGCPIKFFTGISCAGCGMTRAWLSALRLDFKSAFYYHPLFFTVPIIFMLVLFKEKLNKKIYNALIILLIISYVTIYAIRLIKGSEIVVFEPYNNILFRIIKGV